MFKHLHEYKDKGEKYFEESMQQTNTTPVKKAPIKGCGCGRKKRKQSKYR